MKLNILIILLYIIFTFQENIQNGVYVFQAGDLYLSYYKRRIIPSKIFRPNTFFRIVKSSPFLNDTLYYIEEAETERKFRLCYTEKKELIVNNQYIDLHLWIFYEIDKDKIIIKNNKNCYIKINKLEVVCNANSFNEATKFKLIKIYNEVSEDESYSEILYKEPIDILIKYIDLRDPDLRREGIHQIEKDYDNEELRYSIRSISDNLPWIRKIFILMPNEKVRFFKDYNLINEKIVYVKDKDFLGYDSSNFNAFLYRYWNMKKFGISDNIIIMDDDCFIRNKLNKSDFFYVKNGRVLPAIITSNFIKIDPISIKNSFDFFEKKVKKNKEEQNGDEFNYSKYLTLYFILNLFNIPLNESIYIPWFTHNAIPVNLRDIKEIYDLAYMSKYKYNTLDCLYRISGYLQFQILMLSYTFIKYQRNVKNIPNSFIQINDSISANYKISLFCINKGAGNFTYLNFYKAKIAMEYLFPNPSPFEILDYSFTNLSFNVAYTLDHYLKICEIQKSQMIEKKEFYILQTDLFVFFVLFFIKFNYLNINYYYINNN